MSLSVSIIWILFNLTPKKETMLLYLFPVVKSVPMKAVRADEFTITLFPIIALHTASWRDIAHLNSIIQAPNRKLMATSFPMDITLTFNKGLTSQLLDFFIKLLSLLNKVS